MATDKQESIIELNRYRNVNRKDISDVINFLKTTSKDKSAPNSWSKRFKSKLTVKGGKLYLEDRLVIANEDRDDLMRKITYDVKSDVAPSRDAGYHLIKKRYANISRRQWITFLKKQRVIRMTDNAPATKKAGGKKLNKKGELEMDLFFISRADVPKHMQIASDQSDLVDTLSDMAVKQILKLGREGKEPIEIAHSIQNMFHAIKKNKHVQNM